MSEMVERVARAFDPNAFKTEAEWLAEAPPYRTAPAVARMMWVQQSARQPQVLARARTAIAAMLEPTEAMVAHAVEKVGCGWATWTVDDPEQDMAASWRAMIDAALAEPTAKPPALANRV